MRICIARLLARTAPSVPSLQVPRCMVAHTVQVLYGSTLAG
jgi:hypothetical protein